MKEFADNNFEYDKNDIKLSEWVTNTVGKGEITQFFLFPPSVFKRLVMQTCKNQGLFGTGWKFGEGVGVW